MTAVDEITGLAAAGAAALPGSGLPPAPRVAAGDAPASRQERELLRVQVKREQDAAKLAAEQARFDMAQAQRQARADQRRQDRASRREEKREDRADRRAARSDTIQAVSGWVAEHQADLLIAPLIGVPAWLGWDAMSAFGSEFWAGPGRSLPVISECGMWLFSFAIARERKKNPNAIVWPLYLAMLAFAGLCAGLNAAHGYLGPLPGVIPPGPGPAAVYAAVSVSGLFAHQIMALSGRVKVARRKQPKAKVAASTPGWWPWKAAKDVAIPAGAGGHGGSRPSGQPDRTRTDGPGNSGGISPVIPGRQGTAGETVIPAGNESLGRGDKRQIMRKRWDAEVAAGRIPSGADLNEAAGNPRSASLGTKYAKEWRTELAAEKISGEGRKEGVTS